MTQVFRVVFVGDSIHELSRRLFLVVSAVILGVATNASAQDPSELKAVYGRGVHAFFAGNLTQAEQLFSQVIDSGSRDPRAYYFRAMIYMKSGRKFQAEYDMRVGATFEAQDPGSRYLIGKSLQRVQGQGRRALEKFRRQARLERVQQMRSQAVQRYEQLENREKAILHKDKPVELETLLGPQSENNSPRTEFVPPQKEATVDMMSDKIEEPAEVDEDDPFDFGEPEELPEEEIPSEEMDSEEDIDDFFSSTTVEVEVSEEASVLEDTEIMTAGPISAGGSSPAGGMFFQLGLLIGRGSSDANSLAGLQPEELQESGFELGPSEDSPFGSPDDEGSFDSMEDDSFLEEDDPAMGASVEDEEDPFAEF